MRHEIHSLAIAMVAALPATLIAGTGRAAVKIGFINSITGPEAPIGENLTNGVALALEDLKKKGIDVTLVRQDDTGKPAVAMSALEQLATGEEVAVVVGPYTSATVNAVAKLAQRYHVPQLIPAASKEEITRQGYDWVFRLNAPAHQYGESLIDAALGSGQPKTIALIYESTDFGSSVAATAKQYAARRGLQVVADEAYQKGAPDYRSTLVKVQRQKPDLILMASYVADAILLMRQSRELGLKPSAFLGAGAGFDTAQFESERDISNLVLSVSQWTPETPAPGAAEFASRYRARYGKKPTYHAACAYAAMIIAAEVAHKAGGDRKKIRDALAAGSWNGIMGPVKFVTADGFTNQNRNVMQVIQYQNGKAETVYPPELARKKLIYPFPGWK
jgi:branched-chain amino acid transport system substrate-binding protein